MLSANRRQIYSEVDAIIESLNISNRNKIPDEIKNYIKENKDSNYSKKIDFDIPISKQHIKRDSLALFAFLNLKYICNDENEKKELMKIYKNNSKKYSDEIYERFNNLNNRKNDEINSAEELQIVELKKEKKSFIKRILDFFKRNK